MERFMKVQQEWGPGSEALRTDLSQEAPPDNVISTPQAWAKLWKAWYTGTETPAVDFEKSLVLVAAAPGPNHIFIRELRLTDGGDLHFDWAATEKAGPGFVAKMLQVDRRGVKTVNGQPLPAP
jgi:hypothetical protein